MARPVALLIAALAGLASGQGLVPRVTNSRGCSGFGQSCTIVLEEGLDVMATFTLDEPIVCTGTDDFECSVIVNISNSHPHLVAVQPCYVRWDRTEWHQSRQVRITAVQNYRDSPSEVHQIHLNAQVLSMASYYNNFDVQDFYIETRNRRTAQCRSTGDPHYTTFDGKYWHYYRASTVTLYRAPNRDFAVQTRTTGYPGRNCGIAGREGPDAVIIDKCGGRLRVQTNFNSQDSQMHPRVQVSGNTYTVYFYSGAWFRAQVNGWGMNVYTASVDFTPSNAPNGMEYTCGLCGNFNGNANDDVPGYRVTTYNGLWPCMKVPSIAPRPRDGVTVTFGDIWSWTYNPGDFTNTPTIVPLPQVSCPYEFQRIDRPIINTEDQEDITQALTDRAREIAQQGGGGFGFTFGNNNTNATAQPNYPLNLAQAACDQQIQNSVTVQRCAQIYPVFNASLANYSGDCAIDYAHSGGPGPTGSAFLAANLRALEADCLQLAVQNNDTSLLALQQVLCDNACSQQGTCAAGARCVCNTGFGGTDCSVDLNAPPVITGVSDLVYDSAGLMRNHTPTEILVSGTNFLLSANLSCRFNTTVTRATYIGVTQILCRVPALYHRGPTPVDVPLQVTNDGVQWSSLTNAHFTYYDGTCLACQDDGTCGPNPSTCIIDGQCYLPHSQQPATATTPTNPCKLCLPASSNTNWTYDYSHRACHPIFSLPIYSGEIVGAATAGTTMLTVDADDNPLVAGDPNYRVTYAYHSAVNDSRVRQWFLVNPTTGLVTLNESVNMSDPVFMNMQHAATNPQNFNGFFRVVATDNQGYTATADVTIDLVPLTVHGAIFPPLGFAGVVQEGARTGDPVYNLSNPMQPLVIAPLTSNVTVTSYEWFLQPQGMTGALTINANTGAVTVGNGALLDYETAWQLNYRVRATVNLQYITPLYIEVLNVEEPPSAVVTSPVAPSVVEGVRTTNFVANLSTVDGDANATYDGGPFTYTLVSGSGGFELLEWTAGDSRTTYLAVRNSTVLDFESSATGAVTVVVQSADPTGRSVQTSVTVHIVDVNEAPDSITVAALPPASRPAGVTITQSSAGCSMVVPENLPAGSQVAAISATDPDAGAGTPLCFVTDSLGHFSQDAQRRFMVLETELDFETNSSFSVAVTCTDATDFSLETAPIFCTATVTDVDEAPILVGWTYTGGTINETDPRSGVTVVGVITVADPDSGTNGGTITITPPTGFTVSQPPTCSPLPNGGEQCSANVILNQDTPLSYENSTMGTVNVPITISQGGLDRVVNVNITVADQPELPTGVTVTPLGTLLEMPPVGFQIARLTVDDPDTTPQTFAVSFLSNPNSAFRLTADPADAESWFLEVNNPSAFQFQETLQRRDRRQTGANDVAYSLSITEPAHPELGSFTYSGFVTVSDRPLEATTNTSTISPMAGGNPVQFLLLHQDIATLDSHLRWTLVSSSLTPTMGAVSLSLTGELTVTSAGGLCPEGGIDTFLVDVRYDFSSYTGTLPPGYAPALFQREITIGSSTSAYPYFNNPTSGSGYSVDVRPLRGSPDTVSTSASVEVLAPCGATVGYDVVVATAPQPVPSGQALTGAEYVRDGSNGYIKPQSLAELNANLASGVWQRSDVYSAPAAPSSTAPNNAFAFSTSFNDPSNAVAQTGTPTSVTATYAPRANPALAYTDASKVLLARIVATGRVTLVPLTVRYLDACGVDASGAQVQANDCPARTSCVSSYFQGAWDYQCIDPNSMGMSVGMGMGPTINIGASSAGGSDDNAAIGMWVGVILAVILVILLVVALFLRHQKKTHEEWDPASGSNGRLPTHFNPTYEAAGGLVTTSTAPDSTFRAGKASAVYEWYKPSMSRRECTDHLMAQGEGSFIVRDSDANPGWHMLGVKTGNRVVHDKIRLNESGEYELLPSIGSAADVKQPSFSSLPDLVDHYLINGDEAGLGYKLVDSNPIYDNHQLIQERTGHAVRKEEDSPAVPEKRHYDAVPAKAFAGGDGVSNPGYGIGVDGGAPAPADGYLDITGEDTASHPAAAYESI